ncbi:hypothetical protein V8G54_005891, partial [Vigna mungo]
MHVDEERRIRYQLLLYQHSTRYHDVHECRKGEGRVRFSSIKKQQTAEVPCCLRYRCCRHTPEDPFLFKPMIHHDFDGYTNAQVPHRSSFLQFSVPIILPILFIYFSSILLIK